MTSFFIKSTDNFPINLGEQPSSSCPSHWEEVTYIIMWEGFENHTYVFQTSGGLISGWRNQCSGQLTALGF